MKYPIPAYRSRVSEFGIVEAPGKVGVRIRDFSLMLPRENMVWRGAQVWWMESCVVVVKRVRGRVVGVGRAGGGGPKRPRRGVRFVGERRMLVLALLLLVGGGVGGEWLMVVVLREEVRALRAAAVVVVVVVRGMGALIAR